MTLMDVARASGVSPSAVSLVLNNAPLARHISAKTKERISEAAKRLGYRPDVFARSLRSQRSRTIGVLIVDLADPFCMVILQGIERKLLPTAYLPIVMDTQNQPHQMERYLEMMMERRVEGLITVANWPQFDIKLLEEINNQQIPSMLVGWKAKLPTMHSVLVDNEAGGYAALQHLYELGHRKVAFVRGPPMLSDSRLRWKGIRRFAAKAGLSLNKKLIRDLPDTMGATATFEGGLRLTNDLIRLQKSFSAILAFDDLTAYGCIRALTEAGCRVPDDCSVIGFDDIPAAALSTPGLTTIRQPMAEMGEYAAEYILNRLGEEGNKQGQACDESRLMPPLLTVRGSTAAKRGRRGK